MTSKRPPATGESVLGEKSPHEQIVGHCLALVESIAGYREDAIDRARVSQVVARMAKHCGYSTLLGKVFDRDPALIRKLLEETSVGETFFFRHASQFLALIDEGILRLCARPREALRAWSAGCATGEEAYSLAAALRSNVPAAVRVEVFGTDLLDRNVQTATEGIYQSWSIRRASPLLYPTVESRGDALSILPELRRLTKFSTHNLLDPCPWGPGTIDVIFCRNVLLYFERDSVETAIAHLRAALAPGGILILGASDLTARPEGLTRWGKAELHLYEREAPASPNPGSVATARPRVHVPSARPRPARPSRKTSRPHRIPSALDRAIDLHSQALAFIERGDWVDASHVLAALRSLAPDYVAGLFEQAMLDRRQGDATSANAAMREILRRTAGLSEDTVLPGPVPLPVAYYRTAADAHLRLQSRGERRRL